MADDTWDGRPQNPERVGWHWLGYNTSDRTIFCKLWAGGMWIEAAGHREAGASLVSMMYRYVGPCLTPAEVAAAVAAERDACAGACMTLSAEHEAFGDEADASWMARSCADAIRARGTSGADALAEVRRQARWEALEEAARLAGAWGNNPSFQRLAAAIRARMEADDAAG